MTAGPYNKTLRHLRAELPNASGEAEENTWTIQSSPPENATKRREAGNVRMDAIIRALEIPFTYGDPANAENERGARRLEFPMPGDFNSHEDFTATLAHELVHWTRIALGREVAGRSMFDIILQIRPSDDYLREELTAEIGAALLLDAVGEPQDIRKRASYIKNWGTAFDTKAEFESARKAAEKDAEKAVDWLLAQAPSA